MRSVKPAFQYQPTHDHSANSTPIIASILEEVSADLDSPDDSFVEWTQTVVFCGEHISYISGIFRAFRNGVCIGPGDVPTGHIADRDPDVAQRHESLNSALSSGGFHTQLDSDRDTRPASLRLFMQNPGLVAVTLIEEIHARRRTRNFDWNSTEIKLSLSRFGKFPIISAMTEIMSSIGSY